MVVLWKFTSREKLELFAAVLEAHDIAFEVQSKGRPDKTDSAISLSVEEKEYEKARRLLMRHRKRRTSGDFL